MIEEGVEVVLVVDVDVDVDVVVEVAMTATVYWLEIPPLVAVIVAVPGPAPVTRPVKFTMATTGSLELQV
jgi:hypothetical protein